MLIKTKQNKMNVWKISSNWKYKDTKDISVLDIFRKNNIVFAGKSKNYIRKSVKTGDLIAVTKGITVVSVGIILTKPKPLTEFKISQIEKKLNEDSVEWIPAFEVKLYDLNKNEQFDYTRGTFNKVHKPFDKIVKKNLSDILNNTGEIFFGDNEQFYVTKIKINNNYKGIKKTNININTNTKWIFFTGNNGYGKTTILQAIAEGLYNQKIDNINITLQNQKTKKSIETFEFRKYKNFADYGTYRAKLNKTVSEEENIHPTDGILGKSETIFNFEKRFKEMQAIPELRKERNFIINILKELIPKLDKIEVIEDEDIDGATKVVYYEKDDNENQLNYVEFNKLAMGMRSIIGLVSDMIFKLSENQQNNTNLKKLYGIVIIDEFDNHLHPKWQRLLVEKLTKIFPKVQFIVSTHSPIPLLGAPKNSVILNVNRTKEEGITVEKLDIDISTLSPNSILTSPVFGFESLIPRMHDGTKYIETEKDYNTIRKNKKIDAETEQFLNKERMKRFNKILNSSK